MPIIVREVEKKVINCLKIVLQYNHTPYPGKGLKTETIGALVQTCRAQHNCKAKLVQKTNKQRTQVTIWLEIASEKDPFADAVFDSIKQNCTYDNIHKEYMQFEFEGNELNTIIPCEVLVRQDGVYISGEEPVQSNSFSFDYLKTIQDNNMYKRKLMNDYSSDNVKSLLSDSSESDTQGLKRKLVAEFSMSKKPRREIQVMNTSYTVDPRIEILTGQPIATTSHATQTTLGMPTAGGSGQQMTTNLNPEPFDLSSWIANKLGLNTTREYHKQRLEELVDAFDRAGFRTLKSVSRIDERAVAAINSKLKAIGKSELEVGEELSLLSN
jgi:hypothetical protein